MKARYWCLSSTPCASCAILLPWPRRPHRIEAQSQLPRSRMSWTPKPQIETAYGSQAADVSNMLGTEVSADDSDRAVIEPWANTVSGPILYVGSATGLCTCQPAILDHTIECL